MFSPPICLVPGCWSEKAIDARRHAARVEAGREVLVDDHEHSDGPVVGDVAGRPRV